MGSNQELFKTGILLGALAMLAQFACSCGPPAGPFPPRTGATTIDGTIVGVDNRSPDEQLAHGLRVIVQPEGQPKVLVELAPGWYLNRQGLHFSERDRLSVEGRLNAGDPVFLASRVTKGKISIALRDASGHPLWDATDAGPNVPREP